MNFSVHIDEETLARVQAAVARVGMTRNRLIVTAVQEWLTRNEARDWPDNLKAHFANPAPSLMDQTLDVQQWRDALPDAAAAAERRW